MTDPINTHNRPRNTGVSADTKAGPTAKTEARDANKKSEAAATDDSSTVELNTTMLLKELEQQIKHLPEVNQAKVEAIKKALASGEYEPDAEVIARKFSEIEKLLP